MLATKAKSTDNLARDGGACQTSKIWTYSAIKPCLSKNTPVGALYQSTEATTATIFEIVSDIRGDVRELRDKDGNTFARYDYDAYGNIRAEDIFATALITEELAQTIATLQPLRYAGYVWDSEIGLYYCSQRYYDPTIGAFISKDPIKADGELSAYAYCAGDPVGRIDPTGLFSMPVRPSQARIPHYTGFMPAADNWERIPLWSFSSSSINRNQPVTAPNGDVRSIQQQRNQRAAVTASSAGLAAARSAAAMYFYAPMCAVGLTLLNAGFLKTGIVVFGVAAAAFGAGFVLAACAVILGGIAAAHLLGTTERPKKNGTQTFEDGTNFLSNAVGFLPGVPF